MGAFMASNSSRALLAFSQSSTASAEGVMLSDQVVMAMGEMVVGTPSRDASALSASSWVLPWDEVVQQFGEFLLLVRWRCKNNHWVWSPWG